MFCVRQTLEAKCEYTWTLRQLFTDFEKMYDSVNSILIEFGIAVELITLIKINYIWTKHILKSVFIRCILYSTWSETRCFIAPDFQLYF
jgi:hypothetical protein